MWRKRARISIEARRRLFFNTLEFTLDVIIQGKFDLLPCQDSSSDERNESFQNFESVEPNASPNDSLFSWKRHALMTTAEQNCVNATETARTCIKHYWKILFKAFAILQLDILKLFKTFKEGLVKPILTITLPYTNVSINMSTNVQN